MKRLLFTSASGTCLSPQDVRTSALRFFKLPSRMRPWREGVSKTSKRWTKASGPRPVDDCGPIGVIPCVSSGSGQELDRLAGSLPR